MAPGTVADRYELADRLGSGGGGIVWRAYDTSLGRTVAVKEIELSGELADADRERRQARALREARSAARLQHRHVVNVYGVHTTDEAMFIVMEHVDAPGIVHRDIKPGNVLVGGPNGAQLTDFGIAHLLIVDVDGDEATVHPVADVDVNGRYSYVQARRPDGQPAPLPIRLRL